VIVYLLLSSSNQVCSIYESREDAEAKRDRFNADPFLELGRGDPDAPYTVAAWSVQATTEARGAA
jgi:hypothetical protein